LHLEWDFIRCGRLWWSILSSKLWAIRSLDRYLHDIYAILYAMPRPFCLSPFPFTSTQVFNLFTANAVMRNFTCDIWMTIYAMPYERHYSILLSMLFCIPLGIWSCCPALSQRRRYCKLAAMDNCVWAVGGLDASSAISNVERLDPREGMYVWLFPGSQFSCTQPSLSHQTSSQPISNEHERTNEQLVHDFHSPM